MRPIEAVVFDVDGTLVDSERDGHRVAFNLAFEEAGLTDRWDVETYGDLLRIAGGDRRMAHWFKETGRPAEEAEALARQLHRRKSAFMREIVESGRIEPRPGTRELIELLRSRGVPVHVATTGRREWVASVLGLFGPVFDTVITANEIPDLKPSPAAYREVLRRTGTGPQCALAIEDSENGVRAATAAGMSCLATYNDYSRDHDLSAAEVIAPTLEDPRILEWIGARLP